MHKLSDYYDSSDSSLDSLRNVEIYKLGSQNFAPKKQANLKQSYSAANLKQNYFQNSASTHGAPSQASQALQ